MVSDASGAQAIEREGGCAIAGRISGRRVITCDEQSGLAGAAIGDVGRSIGPTRAMDSLLPPVAL